MMQGADWKEIQELFHLGLTLNEEGRKALLRRRYPDATDLHEELDLLWKHYKEKDTLLDSEAVMQFLNGWFEDKTREEPVPQRLGSYRIIRPLSDGGMGRVYLAEQQQPVKRKVALKIITSKMPSVELKVRFESEQQALALMDHPNIATVFDTGSTDEGLAFYTMEYLKAKPITQFCDDYQLTIEERLLLFLDVCGAVQHAHRKGVIHRDLKPTNVLVTVKGGKPIPKVIDFGIAKLKSTSEMHILFQTQEGTVIGTPAYMSPEQAGARIDEIDTASDIYTLGIFLHELLTGLTPFHYELGKTRSLSEVWRIIQEKDPKEPSELLWIHADSLNEAAANRKETIRSLRRKLENELDWIVLKAIEKSPDSRYAAVAKLSEDLENYLNGFPVSASQGGTLYHFLKLFRRKKRQALLLAAFFAVIIAGLISTGIGFFKARAAYELARQQQRQTQLTADKLGTVNRFLRNMFRSVDPAKDGRQVKVLELLDQASMDLEAFHGQPENEAGIRNALGESFVGLGLYRQALPHFETAWSINKALFGEKDPNSLETAANLAMTLRRLKAYNRSQSLYMKTWERQKEVLGENHPQTLETLSGLAILLHSRGQYLQAERIFRECYRRQVDHLGESDPQTLVTKSGLANTLRKRGKLGEAKRLFMETLWEQRSVLKPHHPQFLATLNNFLNLLMSEGSYAEAEPHYRELVRVRKIQLGEKNPFTLSAIHGLGRNLFMQGHRLEAASMLEEAYLGRLKTLGANDLDTLNSMIGFAAAMGEIGYFQEAITLLGRVPGVHHPSLDSVNATVLAAMNNLSEFNKAAGNLAKAERLIRKVVQFKETKYGVDSHTTIISKCSYVELLLRKKDFKNGLLTGANLLEDARRTLGEAHPDSLFIESLLGLMHLKDGNLEEGSCYLSSLGKLLASNDPRASTILGLMLE